MLLVVARVGRAHGVKGEVAVEVRTDEPETRLAPGSVLLTDPPERGPLTLRSSRDHSGRLLVRFAGVDDRTAAEALRGTLLQVDVDPAATPDEDDAWYDHQLVGLVVVDTGGEVVGEVGAVLHLPAQDLLAVVRADASEVLVPFVRGIVPTVDVVAGRVVVDPPPGLLDERDAVVAGDGTDAAVTTRTVAAGDG
jgi:16S rRNA processing protein RimM